MVKHGMNSILSFFSVYDLPLYDILTNNIDHGFGSGLFSD